MRTWMLVALLAVAVLLIGTALCVMCAAEIRVRLIPEREVVEVGEALRDRHGTKAEDVALRNAADAIQSFRLFEAGRWCRIGKYLGKDMVGKGPR